MNLNRSYSLESQSQSLAFVSNTELIQRLEKLVRTERKITHFVLAHIAEIEKRRIYADLGFDGMYTYLTRGLGCSEGSAVRRLQSARLLMRVTGVAEKIELGSLNLSQLTQVQKCLKESRKIGESISNERTLEILEKIEHKNSFDTEKTLATEMNMPIQEVERVKPQKNESVRIEITLSQEEFAELERAKSLLSHICHGGSLGEVIGVLAKKYNQSKLQSKKVTALDSLESIDVPLIKYQNSIEDRNLNKSTPLCDTASEFTTVDKQIGSKSCELNSSKSKAVKLGRKYISIHTKRSLLQKARYCCEFKDPKTQRKCGSKYKLEIDHRLPVALGGGDELGNLRILCQTHNLWAARKANLI